MIKVIRELFSQDECSEAVEYLRKLTLKRDAPKPGLWEIPKTNTTFIPDTCKDLASVLSSYAKSLDIVIDPSDLRRHALHYLPGNEIPWHSDYRPDNTRRKVTASVALLGPHPFEYIFHSGIRREKLEAGDVILYPAFLAHRVPPAENEHYALAMWYMGPMFG